MTLSPWALLAIQLLFFGTMVALPLLARQDPGPAFHRPSPCRCVIEGLWALPLLVVLWLSVAALGFIGDRLWPEGQQSGAFESIARSRDRIFAGTMMVVAATVGPIAEEMFFRGFLHHALRARMPWILAVVIQSLLFGVMHDYGPLGWGLVAFMGVFLTLVYEWRRTLLAPILLHAAFNGVGVASLLLTQHLEQDRPLVGVLIDPDQRDRCVVLELVPGGGAEEAGILVGDEIIGLGEWSIGGFDEFLYALDDCSAGETVWVWVLRDGKELAFPVRLRARGPPPP